MFIKILLIILLSLLISCRGGGGVFVGIPPYLGFTESFFKGGVKVLVSSPHLHEVEPGKIMELKGGVYIAVGSGIEFEVLNLGKIGDVAEVIDSSRGVKVEGGDPHIWFSLKNIPVIVENIYEGLSSLYPGLIEPSGKEEYLRRVRELDRYFEEAFRGFEGREVFVYHPAFGYFLRDYGLLQVAIEEKGREPTPSRLKEIIERAKASHTRVIFATPFSNLKLCELVAKEIGGKVVVIDPLSEDILSEIEKFGREVLKCLRSS